MATGLTLAASAVSIAAIALLAVSPTRAEAPATAVEAWMARAEAALRQNELQLAESHYRSALFEGWLLLGDLAVAGGTLDDAIAAYERAGQVSVEVRRPATSLALVYLNTDQPEQAVATLRGLLARDPFHVDSRRLLAQALVSAGRTREAVQEMREIVDADPDDLETVFSLASGHLRLGEVETAADLFERLAEERPIPQTHVLIGRTYRDFKHYDLARAALGAALELDPTVRRADYYLGTILLLEDGRARLDEAIAHFERELSRFADDALCNLFLGMALVEGRRYDEALAPLEIAVAAPASRIDALHFRGRALLGVERTEEAIDHFARALEGIDNDPKRRRTVDPSQLESLHYQRAQGLRRLGREAEARVHFDAAKAAAEKLAASSRERLDRYLTSTLTRSNDPANFAPGLEVPSVAGLAPTARSGLRQRLVEHLARALINLGIQQTQGGRFAGAADLFAQAVELAPDFPQAQRSLAIARFNAGQLADAIAPLEEALDTQPGDLDLRRMLALAKLDVGAHGEAAALLRNDPRRAEDPSLEFALGLALVRSGDTDGARQVFDRLLEERADWPELHVLLGQASAQDGDFKAAIGSLEHALRLNATVAEAQGTLGVIYLRQGELEAAETALQAELEHHPNDRRTRYHLATVLDLRDRPEEAEPHLQTLLEQDPTNADARYLLGKILLGRGALADATAQLEAAIELSPEDPNLYNQLGRAYQQQGKTDLARVQFERFRQLKKAQRGEDG